MKVENVKHFEDYIFINKQFCIHAVNTDHHRKCILSVNMYRYTMVIYILVAASVLSNKLTIPRQRKNKQTKTPHTSQIRIIVFHSIEFMCTHVPVFRMCITYYITLTLHWQNIYRVVRRVSQTSIDMIAGSF